MSDTETKTKTKPKIARPRRYMVILLNDDYTPREFVIRVLKAVFKLSEDQSLRVMITAHTKGKCVVTVLPKDAAETKAREATDFGAQEGYPLLFVAEPEE
ncbi:ATP-dependent Clp protease adaptor ClpS [Hoeflea sp. CAU 1731]